MWKQVTHSWHWVTGEVTSWADTETTINTSGQESAINLLVYVQDKSQYFSNDRVSLNEFNEFK